MGFWTKKKCDEVREGASRSDLKKNLGAWDLVNLGLGGIIGSGIFVITGYAAAKYAGPAITVSYFLAAICCIFTALAYAELASMLPVAGSAYSYAYVIFGEGIASILGWAILMVCTFGASAVGSGWSSYAVGILESFGIFLPSMLTHIPADGGIVNLPAVLIVLFLCLVVMQGTDKVAKWNGLLVYGKLFAIFLFLAFAFPHVDFGNWSDFAPHGLAGIMSGAGFIFYAYTGFDAVATAAEECRNPNRDLPIGIIGSLVGSALLYIVVSGVLTLIVPYGTLENAEPMARALRAIGVDQGARIVAAGALAGFTTVILSQLYSQSRILMVMARDGNFFAACTRIDPVSKTPRIGIVASGIVIALIAGFSPVARLGQLSSMSTLLVFASASFSVIMARLQFPDEKRTFRCPWVYVVASIAVLLSMYLFCGLFLENALPFTIAFSGGVISYVFFAIRKR